MDYTLDDKQEKCFFHLLRLHFFSNELDVLTDTSLPKHIRPEHIHPIDHELEHIIDDLNLIFPLQIIKDIPLLLVLPFYSEEHGDSVEIILIKNNLYYFIVVTL